VFSSSRVIAVEENDEAAERTEVEVEGDDTLLRTPLIKVLMQDMDGIAIANRESQRMMIFFRSSRMEAVKWAFSGKG